MPVSSALLIAGAVVLIALVAGILLRAQDGRKRSGGAVRLRQEDLPGGALTTPALVQFSTELCARCPQVRRLLGEVAGVSGIAHLELDVTHRGDIATRYHVLQTPTTFLVDGTGSVVARWGGVPDRASILDAVTSLPTSQKQEHS